MFYNFRGIADRFGVAKSTAWSCVKRVSQIFCDDVQNYIKWPSEGNIVRNAGLFQEIADLPGVIGCVDGSEIPIIAPINNAHSYYNRKSFYSITLQGTCDMDLNFIDTFIGCCGSSHDARIWAISDLREAIEYDRDHFIPRDYHILGDSAYPLKDYLLTPYRDNGYLNDVQTYYNVQHSKTRVDIERTFGLLKCRWRRLKYLIMYDLQYIPLIIQVCCILHNICISFNDELDENYYNSNDGDNNCDCDNDMEEDLIDFEEKRDHIAQTLYERRCLRRC